jgi:hypothetical protein
VAYALHAPARHAFATVALVPFARRIAGADAAQAYALIIIYLSLSVSLSV